MILGTVLILVYGCHVTDLPLWGPDPDPSAGAVETIRGISYGGPDRHRNRLDVFVPRGKTDCPVVVFVHGGAWVVGDNRCCGLYSSVGEFLASQGIVAVLPNYRLSPEVRHPEHIKDVARAVAWARAHAAEHGGRPEQLFLMGHSAGGHLVSLLATDEQYLNAEGLCAADLKGVIAVSGVYHIPANGVDLTLGGQAPDAMRWDKVLPLRGPSSPRTRTVPGIPLSLDVYDPAFGRDADVRAAASPINHIRPGLPPFLMFCADNDLPTLPAMAAEFHQALLYADCEAQLLVIPQRNHNSIIFEAMRPDDPVAAAVLAFIARHRGEEPRPGLGS
jgi:acetyl esterase/lipase